MAFIFALLIPAVFAKPVLFAPLTFSNKNQAHINKNSDECRGVEPQAAKLLLCEPDPYDTVCRSAAAFSRDRATRLLDSSVKLGELYGSITKRIEDDFMKTLPHDMDALKKSSLAIQASKEKIKEKFFKEAGIWSRERMGEFVKETSKVFLKSISKSRVLGTNDLAVIEKVVDSCAKNISLQLEHATNLRINREFKMPVLSDNIERKINEEVIPLGEGLTCDIKINLRTWLDCMEGSPRCYFFLFHELGHLMNPCMYWEAAGEVGRAGSEWLSRIANRGEIKKAAKDHAAGLAETLSHSTECLSRLSGPKDAVPNNCSQIKRPNFSAYGLRCNNWQNVSDHPSQWDEAQADFWAATALAEKLKQDHKESLSRNQVVSDIIGEACAEAQVLKERYGGGEADYIEHSSESCVMQPKAGYAGAFNPDEKWDSHQKWPVRMNRNILRNADLRSALGCELTDEVPMACSPLGIIETLVPR